MYTRPPRTLELHSAPPSLPSWWLLYPARERVRAPEAWLRLHLHLRRGVGVRLGMRLRLTEAMTLGICLGQVLGSTRGRDERAHRRRRRALALRRERAPRRRPRARGHRRDRALERVAARRADRERAHGVQRRCAAVEGRVEVGGRAEEVRGRHRVEGRVEEVLGRAGPRPSRYCQQNTMSFSLSSLCLS